MHMDNLFSVKQMAFILKVHPLTIRRHLREKKLTAIKVGGAVRIKEEDFLKFQKEYSARKTFLPRRETTAPESPFSFNDPFWRLNGSGMSLAT